LAQTAQEKQVNKVNLAQAEILLRPAQLGSYQTRRQSLCNAVGSSEQGHDPRKKSASPKPAGHPVKSLPKPQVNIGNSHGRARAVEESPTFSLQKDSAPVVEEDAGKLLQIGRVSVAIRRPVHLTAARNKNYMLLW
jgi:hypothetical protein